MINKDSDKTPCIKFKGRFACLQNWAKHFHVNTLVNFVTSISYWLIRGKTIGYGIWSAELRFKRNEFFTLVVIQSLGLIKWRGLRLFLLLDCQINSTVYSIKTYNVKNMHTLHFLYLLLQFYYDLDYLDSFQFFSSLPLNIV